MPNINMIYHYFGKAGRLLGITMEARNGLTHFWPIMWKGGVAEYNNGRTNILKLLCNNTKVVSIKKKKAIMLLVRLIIG